MRKEFNVGEYYLFNDAKKKVGKERIYSIVQVEGKPYAVVSFGLGGTTEPFVLPIKHDNGRAYIDLFGRYLNIDAPVLPKTVKFKIGETYIDDRLKRITVTAKYTDNIGSTYIVLGNRYVAKVSKIDVDDNVVEYANYISRNGDVIGKVVANKTLKEIEE